MSKKKKNIRRKKSNNLLKGMAAAGAVEPFIYAQH